MKPQEIELWAREIVETVLNGQPVEDSRVELKAEWIDPVKAAPRLGGHANASRGENILWVIGIDERNKSLRNVDASEKGSWYKAVEKHFDGFAPRLLADVNLKINGSSLVALYFDSSTEAPYVIKSSKGAFPEYIVPWRVGTDLRAASRSSLLSLLVPIRKMSALIAELEFNSFVSKTDIGGTFRNEEFREALKEGLLDTLKRDVRDKVLHCYVCIDAANKQVDNFISKARFGFIPVGDDYFHHKHDVIATIKELSDKISATLEILRSESS